MYKKIEELAKRGEQHDIMDALRLLTKAYMEIFFVSGRVVKLLVGAKFLYSEI